MDYKKKEDEEVEVGFQFSMPLGGTLKIKASKSVDDETEVDEIVDGVVYRIYWNGVAMPWCTATRLQAIAIAFGCQWGASEMYRKIN